MSIHYSQTCNSFRVIFDLFPPSPFLWWFPRRSANCVLLIIQLKQYKYTRHHGPFEINRDFHFVDFC